VLVNCYPTWGPPQTFCSCGHYIEVHVRIPNGTAAVCVTCMAMEVARLERMITDLSMTRVSQVELTAEEREALELIALRRLLEKAHRDEDGR
jgi:predicted nucleic acid-binding Zn finger protein